MKAIQTIRETIRLQRASPDASIYLLMQGAFYHAYNEGAEHLHAVMGYQLRVREDYTMLGFPISSLDCVLDRIHAFYDGNKHICVDASRYPHLVINLKPKTASNN